ncbi:MAG: TetR/AcrR family transcriptional regulator [Pseudomonadales bacterium]
MTEKIEVTLLKAPSQDRSRRRIRKILESTKKLLRDQGIRAVTTTRIADLAGIPVGSIYQYFPNKKAIFVTLYDEYLVNIRKTIEAFEQKQYPHSKREEVVSELLSALLHAEKKDKGFAELANATNLFPELREIDKTHGDMVAGRIAALLKQLGSNWPTDKLRRLSLFTYHINAGSWLYRELPEASAHEALQWEQKASLAVLRMCFESKTNS